MESPMSTQSSSQRRWVAGNLAHVNRVEANGDAGIARTLAHSDGHQIVVDGFDEKIGPPANTPQQGASEGKRDSELS